MLFRLLDQNKVGTFLLLIAAGTFAFWALLAMVFGNGVVTPTFWGIPTTFLIVAATHLAARPLVRKSLGLTPIQ